MALETTKWDATDYLDGEEAIAAYLEAAFEDGHPAVIVAVLDDIARAKGITQVAEALSERRSEALHAAGCPEGSGAARHRLSRQRSSLTSKRMETPARCL